MSGDKHSVHGPLGFESEDPDGTQKKTRKAKRKKRNARIKRRRREGSRTGKGG